MVNGPLSILQLTQLILGAKPLTTQKKTPILSSDGKWSIIHSLTKSIDLVMLAETKTVFKTTQWANFFPLSHKFKSLTNSCSELSDGFIIFGNTDSISNHTIDILHKGRAVLNQFKKKTIKTSLFIQCICHPVTILIVCTPYT